MYTAIFASSDDFYARYDGERVDVLSLVNDPYEYEYDPDFPWYNIRFSDGNETEVCSYDLSDWQLHVLTRYNESSTVLTP